MYFFLLTDFSPIDGKARHYAAVVETGRSMGTLSLKLCRSYPIALAEKGLL